ncbi:hypothetical protein [Sphingomonas aerophila]|uniref:ChaN family lipoprotein n=1 Tax=Sphingomonas aerophila TaxID=1344948 RepID=A0A7W9BGQ3_9SPHN|nr:hypothetical protein [Sphingomonas aerophila]MBB5716561.1 hypothetical protein [Sphingomonas aerophila]
MKRLLVLSLALLASSIGAQEAFSDAATAGNEALDRGEYLRALTIFKAAALKSDGTIADEGAFQAWEQALPMVAGELPVGGLRPRSGEAPSPDPEMLAQLRSAIPHDAVAEIVARARSTRIVVLNEAHLSPRDRAFGLGLARALKPLGYTILAAEAFNNDVDPGPKTPLGKLARDGIVRQSTGSYTGDPVFAAFVREAMALGYAPAAYDWRFDQFPKATASREESIAVREEAQAQNIRTALLRSDPKAKVLIYVGYSHVAEEPMESRTGGKSLWMAGRLKRLTGIDPLTIDQTTLVDTAPSVAAAYSIASAHVTRPSALFAAGIPLVVGQYAGRVDLQIVHPHRTYHYGRPGWLSALGGRPLAIPATLLPTQGQRLVQAFAVGAPKDAVPLDQVLVEAGKTAPMLLVPPGKVRFAVQDPN